MLKGNTRNSGVLLTVHAAQEFTNSKSEWICCSRTSTTSNGTIKKFKKKKKNQSQPTYIASVCRTTASWGFQLPKALQLPHIAKTSPKKSKQEKKPHNHHYSRLDGIKKYSHSQTSIYFKCTHQNHSSKTIPVQKGILTPPKTPRAFSLPSQGPERGILTTPALKRVGFQTILK